VRPPRLRLTGSQCLSPVALGLTVHDPRERLPIPLKVANFNAAVLFCSDQKNLTNKSDPKPDGLLGNAFLDFTGSDEAGGADPWP
jgi:hypothetical protein